MRLILATLTAAALAVSVPATAQAPFHLAVVPNLDS